MEGNVDIGVGYESNVFLSDTNPQSDSFILLDTTLNGIFIPDNKSLIFSLLNASFQHFSSLDQADRTFANLAAHYRYRFVPSFTMGVSNVISYVDLRLLDSEGDALPIDQFRSLSDQVRIYGLIYPVENIRIDLGAFYRFMDVKEMEGEPSLDFNETGGDISAKSDISEAMSLKIKYRFKRISYDEKLANNRDTSFNGLIGPANPTLRINRHVFSLRMQFDEGPHMAFMFRGEFRINDDLFQDDLSYRQGDLLGSAHLTGLRRTTLDMEIRYKSRYYTERKNRIGSDDILIETFYMGDITLSKIAWKVMSVYLKYQGSIKHSNDASREYENHQSIVGLSFAW